MTHETREYLAVWDPFVRTFHWSLFIGYLLAWGSGDDAAALHERAGYFILLLIGLRLLWGVVGTRPARFTSFVRGPRRVAQYLRSLAQGRPQHHTGHNPAGGWMVLGLLASLVLTGVSGALLTGAGGERWEELHEAFAGLSLALVLVHIGGVVVGSVLHRENLVRAMINGHKWGIRNDV